MFKTDLLVSIVPRRPRHILFLIILGCYISLSLHGRKQAVKDRYRDKPNRSFTMLGCAEHVLCISIGFLNYGLAPVTSPRDLSCSTYYVMFRISHLSTQRVFWNRHLQKTSNFRTSVTEYLIRHIIVLSFSQVWTCQMTRGARIRVRRAKFPLLDRRTNYLPAKITHKLPRSGSRPAPQQRIDPLILILLHFNYFKPSETMSCALSNYGNVNYDPSYTRQTKNGRFANISILKTGKNGSSKSPRKVFVH